MSHALHSLLLTHGFEHKLTEAGHHEYHHPALPRLWTTIADYDSYAAQKAVEHALNKLRDYERTQTMSTTENPWTDGIVLTPNYERMFKTMLHQAVIQSEARTLFDSLGTVRQTAKALRAVQRFLAPLNIACQCMTNREAVERFREALNQIVQDIDKTAGEREEFVSTWEERNGTVDQD